MFTEYNAKNYVIIKLRYYANSNVLATYYKDPEHANKPFPRQHYKHLELHNEFFWKFIEKLSNKNRDAWTNEFLFDTNKCVRDEIQETHGILTHNGEGWFTYYIPKQHVELIGWFMVNIPVPSIIAMKTRNLFGLTGIEADKFIREDSRERTKNFKEKHNL